VAVAAYLKSSNRQLKKTLLFRQSYHALNDFARYVYFLVICDVGHLKNSDYDSLIDRLTKIVHKLFLILFHLLQQVFVELCDLTE